MVLFYRTVQVPWIFLDAPWTLSGAPRIIQGNLTGMVLTLSIDLVHKSQNAPALYPTMLHSEQKCAHFCFGIRNSWVLEFVKLVYSLQYTHKRNHILPMRVRNGVSKAVELPLENVWELHWLSMGLPGNIQGNLDRYGYLVTSIHGLFLHILLSCFVQSGVVL